MSEDITKLERQMTWAAQALDVEEEWRLHEQINLLRGGAAPEDAAAADNSILTRQKSGAMGIGPGQANPSHRKAGRRRLSPTR